jgi:hypothetical protein
VFDGFSKFVSFFPVRRITEQVVCDCLERGYFPVYGTPVSVATDNAKVFRSKQVKDMCFRLGINHITTTTYYQQGPLAERVNRNLKSALKIFHHNSQDTWDEDLPWLIVAFNTAVHESTNCTPDKLFLGREMKLPLLNRWELASLEGDSSDQTRQKFWTQAYNNLKRARSRVAAKYDASHRPHKYQVGDTVVYRLNVVRNKAARVSAKFHLKWPKPIVIAKIVRPNVLLLANPDTGVIIRKVHVSQLKRYVA